MVLYGQLVCSSCSRVLTYSIGALSCRCQACGAINPAQHMSFDCPQCRNELLLPVNTLQALCPCCTAVTDIPIERLPPVPRPAQGQDALTASQAASMYVQHPATCVGEEQTAPSMCIAMKIL
jgi:LSD1 subclass zinc finger protein